MEQRVKLITWMTGFNTKNPLDLDNRFIRSAIGTQTGFPYPISKITNSINQ